MGEGIGRRRPPHYTVDEWYLLRISILLGKIIDFALKCSPGNEEARDLIQTLHDYSQRRKARKAA